MTLTKIPFEALQKISRYKPIIKNHIPPEVEEAVIRFSNDQLVKVESAGVSIELITKAALFLRVGCTRAWKPKWFMKMKNVI